MNRRLVLGAALAAAAAAVAAVRVSQRRTRPRAQTPPYAVFANRRALLRLAVAISRHMPADHHVRYVAVVAGTPHGRATYTMSADDYAPEVTHGGTP